MSKPKTGEALQWRKHMKTWVGRVRGYPEGCARGRWLSLGSDNRGLAQARYDRWLETGVPPKEANEETFAQAAERIVDDMSEETPTAVKKKKDRRYRLRSFACPIMGHIAIPAIEPNHVTSVLDSMPKLGLLKGTILKTRSDISRILTALQREGAILLNFAKGASLPELAVEDGRLRQVLVDEEFRQLWESLGFESELGMASLVCREVAGHRTSDILASRYEHVDWEARTWKVRRPKTDDEGELVVTRRVKSYELVEHAIADHVYGPMRAWWQAHGCPAEGPMFPVRRAGVGGTVKLKDGTSYERQASSVGDHKGQGTSYCKAFRAALWKAKIYRPMPGFDPAKPDKKFCRLQTDTKESRRADFHSVRRRYVTACKSSGMSTADVLAASGHTQLSTSNRYDAARRITLPEAAMVGGKKPSPEAPAPLPPAPAPAVDVTALATQLATQMATQMMAQMMAQMAALSPSVSIVSPGNSAPIRGIDPDSGSKASPHLTLVSSKSA